MSAIEEQTGQPASYGRAEHEVVDEQLRPTVEELGERLRPRLGLEAVVLLDRHPGELAPLTRELVAAAGELLLLGEQLLAGRIEFLLGTDLCSGIASHSRFKVIGDYPEQRRSVGVLVLAPGAGLVGLDFGVRSSRNEWYGATNGSGAITV